MRVQAVYDFSRGQKNTLPALSNIAMDHAFIISSSAPVERVFSYYNKLLQDDRSRLIEEHLKQLLFLYVNASKL